MDRPADRSVRYRATKIGRAALRADAAQARCKPGAEAPRRQRPERRAGAARPAHWDWPRDRRRRCGGRAMPFGQAAAGQAQPPQSSPEHRAAHLVERSATDIAAAAANIAARTTVCRAAAANTAPLPGPNIVDLNIADLATLDIAVANIAAGPAAPAHIAGRVALVRCLLRPPALAAFVAIAAGAADCGAAILRRCQ